MNFLKQTYVLPLSILHEPYCISAPGIVHGITIFSLETTKAVHPKHTELLITLISNYYESYSLYFKQSARSCSGVLYAETSVCENLTFAQENQKSNRFIILNYDAAKISWHEASQKCEDIGGHLPSFASKLQVEKVLAFVKFYVFNMYIQPLSEIFIGLEYNFTEVSRSYPRSSTTLVIFVAGKPGVFSNMFFFWHLSLFQCNPMAFKQCHPQLFGLSVIV